MENVKKQNAILYIEKDQGHLFISGKEPLVMRFPKDIVSNLEIVDTTKFQQMVVHFLSAHEIKPMQVLLVLSPDIVFEKVLDTMPLSLQHIEKEKFMDVVPFNKIAIKTFRIQNKAYIVAANKDFIETVVQVLQEEASLVIGVVALSSIQKKLPEIKDANDLPNILKKIDTFKSYNVITVAEQQDGGISYKVPSFKNPQFIALISVFVLLLIVLGFEVYTQILHQEPHAASIQPIQVVKKVTPVPIVTSPTPSTTITPEVLQ